MVIGFVVGMAVILVVGGLVLRFGSPSAWPTALSTGLQVWRGEQLYNANCLACHGGPIGGTVTDSPPRHNANGHTWHHPDCALRQMVREGSAGIFAVSLPDSPKMQPFKDRLSPEEIDAVLAYIKTMWTPEQREAQAGFTHEMCFDGST
jgi:mono/diheme cytochrome c family protein